jgi:hypothetical protein
MDCPVLVAAWKQTQRKTEEMMKYLHCPEGSRALDVHRGNGQAVSEMYASLLDRQSIDAGETFLTGFTAHQRSGPVPSPWHQR